MPVLRILEGNGLRSFLLWRGARQGAVRDPLENRRQGRIPTGRDAPTALGNR